MHKKLNSTETVNKNFPCNFIVGTEEKLDSRGRCNVAL